MRCFHSESDKSILSEQCPILLSVSNFNITFVPLWPKPPSSQRSLMCWFGEALCALCHSLLCDSLNAQYQETEDSSLESESESLRVVLTGLSSAVVCGFVDFSSLKCSNVDDLSYVMHHWRLEWSNVIPETAREWVRGGMWGVFGVAEYSTVK